MATDVLSDVLAALELSAVPWFRAELHHPFSVAVPGATSAGTIRFHVATENGCTISVRGGPPTAFAAGDLVLVPGGAEHVLADAPGREPLRLEDALRDARLDGMGPVVLGSGPQRSVLVCGEFRFAEPALHPFVSSLPPLLHVPADDGGAYEWIEHILRHLEREARGRGTGHLEVIRRLAEILLIEVLRTRSDDVEIGALAALTDPQLGRALQAIHDQPEADWKLEQLARIAGQSRTLFAEKFRERVGLSPMKYLCAWRMQKARRLLAETDASVGEVARRVGYHSESAFNRTFRVHYGASPGAHRP